MRKIEKQIITAIKENKDLKIANSEVISCSNVSDVYLHGNLIARIGETWMELFDGGYQSNTTKSRLNALLSAFGMEGEYIFQKNFQWFINYQGAPIPFFDGMRLAWFHLLSNTHFPNIMNRQQLQDAYINQVIDNMDHKDMWALLFDFMDSDLDKYSDQQLIEEVSQYYPELIEGW